jgi:L-asparaginase II
MDDGNTARAVEVVMARVIEALVQRDDADAAALQARVNVRLVNWNGIEVGRLTPAEALGSLA